MSDGDARHPGRLLRRLTAALVALVLLTAVAAYAFELGPRWFGFDYPSPVDEPAAVAPPPGLTLPDAEDPAAVADVTEAVEVDRRAVRRAVAKLVRDRDLGRDVAVSVTSLPGGEPVYRRGEDRVIPASTLKMLTAAAVLQALGPDHRFRTTVVAPAGPEEVVLVGGGDPLLARSAAAADDAYPTRADIDTLARATARSLRETGRTRVRLGYDGSLFSGPAVSPDWRPSYVPDNVVTPISALWVDEGLPTVGWRRSTDPARAAAEAFVRALERRKVNVAGAPRPRVAPNDATEVAAVEGAPLSEVVEHVLAVSDNEGAEVLARHVALAAGEPASFAGASRAVAKVLAEVGVDTGGDRILDGSGLSRENRLRPETLSDLVAVAAGPDRPELRAVLTGLPVAGFTGSLTYRFDTGDRQGLGAVRAKTGTLSRVHGLAGTVTTQDGAVLGFVAVADRVRIVDSLDAREVIDELAAALAACACAA